MSAARAALRAHLAPLLFAALTLAGIAVSGVDPGFVLAETVARFGRNALLVLSLVLPIRAGLGLNFGIVIGAMAGQTAIIAVLDRSGGGIAGIALALALAVPLAAACGVVMGTLLNRVRGREMVTALVAAFFANGVYQMVFLFAAGPLLPVRTQALLLPSGRGLRNTLDLLGVQYALDRLVPGGFLDRLPVRLPLATLALIAAVAAGHAWLARTRLGREVRAVGEDARVAAAVGIDVDRVRLLAIVLSTIVAALGQIVFLQNLGSFNTYNAHEQVGTFAVAALLVSGATVRRASVLQALLGTALFHALFVVAPLAGKAIAGDAQVGEYLRAFLAYAVICGALALHARAVIERVPSEAGNVAGPAGTREAG